MRLSQRFVVGFSIAASLIANPVPAAEPWPAKPVRWIAPFGPGSTDDIVARVVAQQLAEQMGRQFVVENRVGATGTLGNASVAKAAPDGYTLLLADAAMTLTANLYKSLPYDVLKDFTPVTQMLAVPQVLVVPAALKVNTLKEFIAYVNANPGRTNYGSMGTGGTIHLASELFKMATRLQITHVPFGGASGDVVTGIAGGQVQMLITTVPTALPLVKSGQLRALAVTASGRRAASLPDVPTMGEAGVPEMSGVYIWFGMAGPAGLPRDIVNRLHEETGKALAVPAVGNKFLGMGAEIVASSPEQFSAQIRNEVRRWGEVAKTTGIALE